MKKYFLLFSFLFVVKILSAQTFVSYINPIDKRFIDSTFIDETGRKVIKVVVPGSPPPKFGYNKVAANISSNAVMLDSVPAFSWSFGCTATSAAMIAGYFDRHGYVNIYSGPTNNGLCPISNSAWGSIILNGEQRDICPLSATMKNVDGRAIRGHVDDYWIQYGSSANDPYITNGWTQHNYQDCTGDFMRTNQSAYGNSDGATTYYFYSNGTPYQGTENADGPYGFQKFLESRGYKVNKRFTQTIKGYDGNSTGFTLNDYKNEIDAGRPVMIHVVGHTMVGCGYDLLTQTIYIHNTWDYNVHSMIWGGEYEGMQMISASVFGLDPVSNCVVPTALKATNITNTSADLSWLESGASTAWELVYYPVNNIGQTVTKTVVDTSKLSVSGLASETKYSWKVRSKCGDRFSDWSVFSEFTTYRSNDLYLVSKLPVGADNVPDNGIYLSFNKTVKPGTGKIKIYNSSDVLFKEVLASNCIYSGLNVFIPCLLEPNTSYYILVDSNAFSDEVGNLFPGILSKSGWTFQTTGSDVYCQITDPSGKYFSNASIYYSISSGANINPIYTNEYGIAKISNPAFPGSLTLIGKFNGTNYLVLKKGISGPKSVFVELSKEDLVDLTLLAKNDQGIALPNSSVYIKPSGINEVFSFGQTLNDGQMICKVSRMLYDQIQVVNFSSQYLLKKNSINCSGSASSYAVDFDASKIPVCKIKPEFTGTFSRKDMLVSINFWGFIFNSDNPLITISTGEPIFYEAWLYKNSNKEELDFYGVNSPVNPSPNETVSIKFDDKVNLELSPDKTTYKPGDIIKLNNKIIDSFNNKALYSWLGSATDNFESVVKLVNPLSTSSFKPYKNELDSTQVNASVYPRITVSDPSGNIIVNIAGQSSWANYEFTLPSQSQEGDYNIEYSFNFGQWANQLLVKKTFKVGSVVPVITSFYPENHSVNVEPDCIPSLTFNTTVEAGTGTVTVYKSDGSVYSRIPASSCIYENNVVRLPRLLDVNSTFYILTDDNAFRNSKGKVAGIKQTTVWGFQTSGSGVYGQVFDVSGNLVSGAAVTYSFTKDKSGYGFYSSTNRYGIFRISSPTVFDISTIGELWISASSVGYIVGKVNVSGVSSTIFKLNEESTVTLTIQSQGRDNLANAGASVYVCPNNLDNFNGGNLDQNGNLLLHITPVNISFVSVLNWNKRLVLSTTGIDCSTGLNSYTHKLNATELGLSEIRPKILFTRQDDYTTYYGHHIAPNLKGEESVWLSSNYPSWFRGAWYIKNEAATNLRWEYGLSPETNDVTLAKGKVIDISWGDPVKISAKPDKSNYLPGGQVTLSNKVSDQFGNNIRSCNTYLRNNSSATLGNYLTRQNVEGDSVRRIVSFAESNNEPITAQSGETIYPVIKVTSPDGSILVNYSGWNSWYSYRFNLPTNAAEGKYYIDYSFNSGPLAGLLAVRDSFVVGSVVPVITSFYPENHSVNVEPDCIPSLTFNTTVEAGTGTVTVYKSDGSVYSRIPASSCIYENNVVRLPRLLDVNSTFYILTDDNAFRNSKGKVAGIKQTTVWGFQTSGSGVYGQVFDVSGNLVSGAAVTYSFTKDKSGYGFYSSTNRYGIFRISSPTVFDISTIGELWISASSVGYIVGKVNVSGVSSTIFKLNEESTVTLTIQSQGRDNLANAGASVYVCPNNLDNFNGGNLDQNGNLLLHITPVNISFVSVLNWNKRLVLSTTGIDCSTGLNSYTHKLNATELGLSEIRPKILFTRQDDYTTYYGHHIAPNLKGEESVWLSSNYPSWFRGAWYIKNEAATNLRWEYGLSPETNDVTLAKGKVIDISWGDPVKISAKPDKSNYLPGGQVTLSNKVSDQFGNNIRSCNTYLRNNSSATLGNYLTRQNVEGDSVRRIVSFAESNNEPITAQSGETIYPVIKVTSPDGSILVNYSGWNSWYSYRFNLPTNAAEGKYYIDYSFNSGPLAGLLAVRDSFVVKSQRHFVPVWTGKGVDHMNINVYSARLDGQDLEIGDEIGIFDGTKCVGVGQVQQSISQTHVLDIIASRDEGTGNGYVSGNTITYKFYDKSKTLEVLNITASYSSAEANWIIDGRYAVGGTSFVSLNGATTATQTISFSAGWNIVSANVKPSNTDMKALFQSLIDAGKLKKVMDESGKTLENFGMFGGWKNNIGSWQPTEGYKVNVTAATALVLEGTPFMLPYDIPLTTGWNIVSYPAVSSQDVKAAFQSLIDSGKLKKVMDESGKTLENFGMFGGWKNNIGSLTAGKGYKVNVTGSCTLTITEGGTKGATIVPEVLASTYFAPVYSGNGLDHMNIHLVNLQASGIKVGDEIGIYDGSLCVGSATIGAEQLMDGSISIPASSNDGLGQTTNGFTCGNPVNLQLFRDGQTYQLNIEKFSGINSFDKNQSLFAQVNIDELDGSRNSNNSDQFKCFPNPFDQEINIEVQYAKSTEVTIEIYNITGQRIKTLFKGTNNGNLLVKWNGTSESGQKVAPGVYLCKVNGQSKQLVFK